MAEPVVVMTPETAKRMYRVVETVEGTKKEDKAQEWVPHHGQAFKVKSESYDYLTCRTWNGTTEGAEDIKVAKPPLLQKTRATAGARDGYTYTQSAAGVRTSTKVADSTTETQTITPSYVAGDVIFAWSGGVYGVGVTDNGIPLTWIDSNLDGRQWSK